MIQESNIYFDLESLNILANNFSSKLKKGSIVFLKGELGSGKTTFARMLINNLYEINKLTKPQFIKSPSFPILLTYHLKSFEIFHYDLYRIKNILELNELNIEENLNNAITLIEWPELILKNKFNFKYHILDFRIESEKIRKVETKIIN